jgi:hypothetical protein
MHSVVESASDFANYTFELNPFLFGLSKCFYISEEGFRKCFYTEF